MKLTINEKISRAKIQIQQRNSFFAYLSLFLKFNEDKNNKLPNFAGMGVNERGDCIFKKEFIEEITKNNDTEQLEGVIIHEILHLAFLHLQRLNERDLDIYNIATDIVVNSLLTRNNFKLPEGCLLPDLNNEITLFEKTPYKQIIKDCDKKTAEEVYDEIKIPQKNGKGKGKWVLSNEDFNKGRFDKHIEAKNLSQKEKKELVKEWNNRVAEAVNVARMKGDLPNGMELLLGKLHEEKINWKALLQRYIVNQLPFDYCYSKPSKKSRAVGVYIPHILKEKIELAVMIDLSGSIGKKEYTDFISEIIGICKAYQERISMRVFSHDTECYDGGLIENGNIEKVKNMSLKGGGGTSFSKPLNYLKEKNIKPKCLIWLTDGFGDEIDRSKVNFDILWILSKGGDDNLLKDVGKIIKLED